MVDSESAMELKKTNITAQNSTTIPLDTNTNPFTRVNTYPHQNQLDNKGNPIKASKPNTPGDTKKHKQDKELRKNKRMVVTSTFDTL